MYPNGAHPHYVRRGRIRMKRFLIVLSIFAIVAYSIHWATDLGHRMRAQNEAQLEAADK